MSRGWLGREGLQAGQGRVGNGGGYVCLSVIPSGRSQKKGITFSQSHCDSLVPFYAYF